MANFLEQVKEQIESEYTQAVNQAKDIRDKKLEAVALLEPTLQNIGLPITNVPEKNQTNGNGLTDFLSSKEDSLKAPILDFSQASLANGTILGQTSDNRFSALKAAEDFISKLPENSRITTRQIHSYFQENFPEIRERKAENVRSQISGILAKLTKNGILRLAVRGTSSEPFVYEKLGQDNQNEEKI